MKKFYAVKKGITPGIYTDWPSCKAQVDGYPGAEYKGFKTMDEAREYLGSCGAGAAGGAPSGPDVKAGADAYPGEGARADETGEACSHLNANTRADGAGSIISETSGGVNVPRNDSENSPQPLPDPENPPQPLPDFENSPQPPLNPEYIPTPPPDFENSPQPPLNPEYIPTPPPEPGCAVAYVDGSYRESAGRFSYGIVFFYADEAGRVTEMRLAKSFSNAELLEMRNVSGEIMGAAQAMKTAKEMGLRKITVFHDYEGIAAWCLGKWRAKADWTAKYKAFYDEISKYIEVEFVKVKGHSGDRFNNLADRLAREALDSTSFA